VCRTDGRFVDEGFRTVKLKIGQSHERDREAATGFGELM